MTTGNDLADFRSPMNLDTGDGQLVGTYWHRVWNGADDGLPYLGKTNATRPDDTIGTYRPRLVRKNWPLPPKRGRRGEHPYDVTIDSFHNTWGTFGLAGWPVGSTTSVESAWGTPIFESKWSSNDDIALLGKLRERIIGSTFNAAVFLAEGNEALHTIAAAASAIDGAYRHARKGDFAAAGKSLAKYQRGSVRRNLASNWLEVQYAVRPLLNDVYDAAVSLAHFTSVPLQQSYTVKKKVNGTVRTSTPSIRYAATEGFELVRLKAIIKEVDIISLLGLTDPASVVWEKLPYSFVVDWFIPVGQFLAARGLSQSLTGLFVTTRFVSWKCNGIVSNTPNLYYISPELAAYRRRRVIVSRTISTTLQVPYPSQKPWGKSASYEHCANALALLQMHHHAERG